MSSHIFSAIMDLKVAFVVICLCALAITSSEAGIPKCCIRTKKNIPRQILMKVHGWDVQIASGACDIAALKLYVKGVTRPICAQPQLKKTLQRFRKQNKQRASS